MNTRRTHKHKQNTITAYLTVIWALRRLPSKELSHQEPRIAASAGSECVRRYGRVELRSAGRMTYWATEFAQISTLEWIGDTHLVVTTRRSTPNHRT